MRTAIIASLILAVGTSLWVWLPRNARLAAKPAAENTLLNKGGGRLSPERITSLRVVTWDSTTKTPKPFEVALKENRWIIPSHFDYPADGGTRVGSTAGSVLDLVRGPLKSSNPKDFAKMGVVDPLVKGAADAEGRGQRVTLKDISGDVVVDLIIGKKADFADVTYVREADSDNVYTTKVNADISTKFQDWVETNFLKLNSSDVRTVGILDYSVDEKAGKVNTRSETLFSKPKDKTDWATEKVPAGKIVNQDTVKKIVDEVCGLRLVGVRPFNPMWLQARGFFLTQQQDLYGREGALVLGNSDGLRYHLFFGEVALDEEEDVNPEVKVAAKERKGHNRYLAVFLSYDKALDESATSAPAPKPGQPSPEAAGQKKAKEAQVRFGRFFYVISDENFKKMRPAADELFKAPEPPKPAEGAKPPEGATPPGNVLPPGVTTIPGTPPPVPGVETPATPKPQAPVVTPPPPPPVPVPVKPKAPSVPPEGTKAPPPLPSAPPIPVPVKPKAPLVPPEGTKAPEPPKASTPPK